MESLKEKIENDFKEALKNKDKEKLSVLRMLKASIKNFAISKKVSDLDENDYLKVINKQVKQVRESIEAYRKGNREDLVEKEERALKILSNYLPEMLSEEEIYDFVTKKIEDLRKEGISEFGRVMKEIMKEIGRRADGRLVNKIVSEKLR
jgi:hypothetical protein